MGSGKIGSIPSKYDYSHERGPSLDEQLSGNGYSHKGNRMAQRSTGAVADLGIRCSSTTDFPNEPQGNNLPPGHPKCSCDNRLLQETELKAMTLFIILPYFGTPNRTNVVGKKRKGCSCIGLVQNTSSQEGNVDAPQLCLYAGQLSLYCLQQVFLQAFSPHTGAQLSRAPGCVPLQQAPAEKAALSCLLPSPSNLPW